MVRTLALFADAFGRTLLRRMRMGPARPTWSFGFEWVVEFLRRDFTTSTSWSYPRLRAELDGRYYPSRFLRRVTRTPGTVGGVRGIWMEPRAGTARSGVIVFFHGGSYIFGSPKTHADIVARLVDATGCRAFLPIYRLAPEHPYPAALEDALAVIGGLAELGIPRSRIVLAGDSAGGNLALVTQIELRDRGEGQAAAALLVSPWLDLAATSPSCFSRDAIDYGERAMLLRHARDFAGGLPLDDPRISPLHARVEGLAPLLIQVGEVERLHDEGVELHRRASAAGARAELDVLADMPHNGPILAEYSEEGRRAVARAARFVVDVLELPAGTAAPPPAAACARRDPR